MSARKRWRIPPPLLLVSFLLLGHLAPSARAGGESRRIADLAAEAVDGAYSVSLRLEGAFSDVILEGIESGLPTSFRYVVEIVRRRPMWNQVLARRVVQVTVDFDSLTRQYRLTREEDGEVVGSAASEKEEEMRRWMTEIQGLEIGPLPPDEDRAGPRYVRARCRLASEFVLFFFPRATETGWARIPLPPAPAEDP